LVSAYVLCCCDVVSQNLVLVMLKHMHCSDLIGSNNLLLLFMQLILMNVYWQDSRKCPWTTISSLSKRLGL
jgi:hypothetical protein